MIRKATKKPVEIEWFSFGDLLGEAKNIRKDYQIHIYGEPIETHYKGKDSEEISHFTINTLEGNMKMTDKDVLIVGVKGEIYPCKKDIFKLTYDFTD
jgi:hypothetical protein